MDPTQLLVHGFGALEHVTNLYALFGFVFIVGVVAIGVFVDHKKAKAGLLIVFSLLALLATYMLLVNTVTDIEDQLLVHLVRERGRSLVAEGVEVQLSDIETLKGKKNWDFNVKLDDSDHVFDEVFKRAGVNADVLGGMDADKWREFLGDLEGSSDTGTKVKAERIKDIPFAKLRVFIDGEEDTGFSDVYFFKDEKLRIPSDPSKSLRATLELVNLYNTKHFTSGEPEAANIRVLDRRRGGFPSRAGGGG